MDEIQNSIPELNLSESSIVKFLKGFSIERSKDKSTLLVSTSNKNEQKIVLHFLSLLDKHIETDNLEKYATPHSLSIPYARQLIEKIERQGINIELDSTELLNAIQECIKNGGQINYKTSIPPYNLRSTLEIECRQAPDEMHKIYDTLEKSGIHMRPMDYASKKNNCEIFPNKEGVVFYDKTATRILNQLINRNIDFTGKKASLSSGIGM